MYFLTLRFVRMAALLSLGLSAGCGELADQDTTPPVLATFHGSLRLAPDTPTPQGNIRLALLWHVPAVDGSAELLCNNLNQDSTDPNVHIDRSLALEERLLLGSLQQAVDISPQFPSAFKLEVNVLPPFDALYDGGGFQIAEGKLVVYRDGNDNNRLDPTTDSLASPDQVLSTELSNLGLLSDDRRPTTRPWAYEVWYLDRPHKFFEQLDLQSGYNVLGYDEHGAKPVTEIELELLPTRALQAQLCTNECIIADTTPFVCPENPAADLPPPEASARSGYLQTGRGFIWNDGPSGFVFESRWCEQSANQYSFRWSRTYADGCSRRRVVDCYYGPAPAPSPSWPCESYLDLSLPSP